MRVAAKICTAIASVLIIVWFAVIALDFISSDYAWVEGEYERLGKLPATDMSVEDKTRVFVRMLQYSRGEVDSLDMTVTEFGQSTVMFNEDELSHMVDVRELMTAVLKLRYILPIAAVILLAFAVIVRKKMVIRDLSLSYLISLGAIAVFAAALAIWTVADFDSFWKVFHIVFLDLESSTFATSESRMIRICPQELFFDMIARFALVFVIIAGVVALLCVAVLVTQGIVKKRKNRAVQRNF